MKGRDLHGSSNPFLLGAVGGLGLLLAVRGFRRLLWPSALLVTGAMVWNIAVRRRLAPPGRQ